jgi:hypothetical protein
MGTLIYGRDFEIALDDRTLSHLQIVLGLKLRRQEGFFLTLNGNDADLRGRCSLWIDPAIPLLFRYDCSGAEPINRDWVDQLILSSYSSGGVQLVP